MRDEYRYHDMPWVSKSRILTHSFCPWSFYISEVKELEVRPIDQEIENKRKRGTNAHKIFPLFFTEAKKHVPKFMKMPLELEPKQSQLYWAFYSICQDVMPVKLQGYDKFNMILSNFCQFQVDNWITISRNFNRSRKAYEEFWVPVEQEVFLEDPEMMYYGTPDAIYKNPDDNYKYHVIDYKTKYPPSGVRNHKGKSVFGKPLATHYMRELHFYAWLVARGSRTIKSKRVKLMPDVNHYKEVVASMVFLGGKMPYSAPKRPNAGTMTDVHELAAELRVKWEKWGMNPDGWEKNMGDWTCPSCVAQKTCHEQRIKEALGVDTRI